MALRLAKSLLLINESRIGANLCFSGLTTSACISHIQKYYCRQRRFYCSDVLMPPQVEGDGKSYPPKIQKLVQEISKLTLMEVADLNELLKKTLKIADVPMAPVASSAATRAQVIKEEESDAPAPVQQKVSFTVKLVKFDETKKVALIKEIKNLVSGMNLVQAKKFVESLPQNVRSDVTKEEAETLKKTLEALGANVEVV